MDKIIYLVVIVIFVFLSFKFEELIYWAVDNTPWIVIGFLIISGIFIAFATIKNLISSYKQNPVKTKKYIIKNLKALIFSLFIALLILGVIILNVFENN